MDKKTLTENEAQLLQAMSIPEPEDYIATAGRSKPADIPILSLENVVEALKTVSDPEIMINIYDMGLVYKIEINPDNGDIYIEMTVTAPTCPVAGVLPQQAAEAVAAVEGAGVVTVKIVWEPAWTPEKMSDEAKALIELF